MSINHARLLAGSVSLTALLASAAAFAQSNAGIAIEEITVTARMRAEQLQDVPISVTAFSARQIEDAHVREVNDFIALVPNVSIATSESAGLNAITIRGITQVRNSEAPVAVVVDGVQQVNSRQFTQQLFDLQSIEVLRGPQGALYGRNATGGAILINTKQPTNIFEGHVRAGYATGKEIDAEASLSGPIVKDKVQFRIGASYVDRDGYFDNIFLKEKQDPYRDVTVRGLLKFTPSDRLTADVRYSHSSTRGGSLNFHYQQAVLLPDGLHLDPVRLFTAANGDADLVDRKFRSTNIGQDDRKIDEVSLKVDYDLGFATLTSITAYNRMTEYTAGDQFPYTASLTVFGALDGTQTQYTDVEAWNQEVRLTSASGQRLRWMVGGNYLVTDRFISSTTGDDRGRGITRIKRTPRFTDANNPTTSFFGDDNRNKAWAVFGNVDYDLTDQLQASAAIRYDEDKRRQNVSTLNTGGVPGSVNRATFSLWQPKFTLTWKPQANLAFFGSWGTGFRSGQFNQNGTSRVAQLAGVNGVSDLVPQEKSSTAEIGFKSEWMDRRLQLNASLFETEVRNQQYFVFLGAVGAQVLVPINKVQLYGGEVEFRAILARGLEAYMGLGMTDSEIKKYTVNSAAIGNRAPYVPSMTYNMGAQYRTQVAPGYDMVGRVDYRRLGRQYWDPENSTPRSAVDLVNLKLGIEQAAGRWSASVTADNLFDKKYNSEFVIAGFAHPAPPRVVRGEIRYNF